MLAKVYSDAVYGVDAFEVEIEVNGASGNSVVVVGLPSQSFGDGCGRKGEEVRQFLQIEDHSAPAALPEKNIFFVITWRVWGTEPYEASHSKKAPNPCKCGYFGDPKRECRCSQREVPKYRERVSGPLLDRIDIHVEVPGLAYAELFSNKPSEPSAAIRERVAQARTVQYQRFIGKSNINCNARVNSKLLKTCCQLDEGG